MTIKLYFHPFTLVYIFCNTFFYVSYRSIPSILTTTAIKTSKTSYSTNKVTYQSMLKGNEDLPRPSPFYVSNVSCENCVLFVSLLVFGEFVGNCSTELTKVLEKRYNTQTLKLLSFPSIHYFFTYIFISSAIVVCRISPTHSTHLNPTSFFQHKIIKSAKVKDM